MATHDPPIRPDDTPRAPAPLPAPEPRSPAHAGLAGPSYLRIRDLAATLNISKSAAQRLARKLRHVKLGNAVLVCEESLREYLARHTVDPGQKQKGRPSVKKAAPKRQKRSRLDLW